jgi:hypothetical protein
MNAAHAAVGLVMSDAHTAAGMPLALAISVAKYAASVTLPPRRSTFGSRYA